jgi:DnaJ-domain-containing protein 1
MSIPDRLWRMARHRVKDSLGLVQGSAFKQRRSAAREELEEFLCRPEATPSRPQSTPAPPQPHTPKPPHPYTREYKLLGAPVGSDLATVRQCWRRMVRETHPDRFAAAQEKEQAAERLRKVNEAYRVLRAHLRG